MSVRYLALCATAALATTPALAGGFAEPIVVAAPAAPVAVVPAPAAPVVASGDWTGLYVGGQVSRGQLTLSVDEDLLPEGEDNELDYDGTLFGAHAGYLRDFGRFVAGVEVAYDKADIAIEDEEFPDMSVNIDSAFRAGVRLGFDAGRVLPYATAGISRVSASTDGFDAEFGEEFDEDFDARFIGAGVEFMVSERFSLGAEVIHHDIELEAMGVDLEDAGADASLTTFGLRGSYHF